MNKELIAELLSDADSLGNLVRLQYADNPKHIDAYLAEDEESFFEVLIGMLDDVIRGLEEDAGNINGLGENALSGLIKNNLQTSFIIQVSREEHSKGHVDLTITRITDGIKILGESKIWDGYAYHVSGCDQLLTYSTGRNKNTFIIEFFKTKDMYKKMGLLQDDFSIKKPLETCNISNLYPAIKGSFNSTHKHSSGAEVSITHTCCNLY